MVTHDPRCKHADRTVHLFEGELIDEQALQANAASRS